MLILYGSETGTAQEVAERIWREAKLVGLQSKVCAMDDYEMGRLIYEPVVIFVVSTTGQGDTPSNMKKSWKFLLRKNLPGDSLFNVSFGVLGLGDSSYVKFNFVAKRLYKRLREGLSARPLCNPGYSDEQHDLGQDAVVDPWIVKLWQALAQDIYRERLKGKIPISQSLKPIYRWSASVVITQPVSMKVEFGSKDFKKYFVKVSENSRTTPEEHFQEVRVLKFTCEEKFEYEPGDVAVLLPENSEESVDKLMLLLSDQERKIKYCRDTVIRIEPQHSELPVPHSLRFPFTLADCAKKYWDLNAVPRRYAFEVMSRVTENELEKEKLLEFISAEGQEELYNYCNRPRRTVLEVLADFPHVTSALELDHLFEIFLPIRPRYFSIASSPNTDKDLQLLVAVVRYKSKLITPRFGLCSNWMSTLPIDTPLMISIKKGSLSFPSENVPIVMVGPGTGVAPFRSYCLTDITKSKSSNLPKRNLILVFGCRNMKADFHFESDLVRNEIKLLTAFSRDQPHKIYVQHLIEQNPKLFFDAIYINKGCVYVAGSANEMPQAVREALIKSLTTAGNLSLEESEKFISEMERKGTYQTETWS